MSSQSFGPRKVEDGALRRWFKEGFKLWKRTASTVLPVNSLYVLAYGTLMANVNHPHVFLKLAIVILFIGGFASLWKSGSLMVNQQAFDGKTVGWADFKQGMAVLVEKRKMLYRIVFSDLIIVMLMMLIVVWMSLSALNSVPPQSTTASSNWLETSIMLNSAVLLTIMLTWQNMGLFALVNSLSICKAGLNEYSALRFLEYKAFSLNPFVRRLELFMGPMMLVLMVIALIIPFAFVLFILLESFVASFATVAFKDIFEGKTTLEVKQEVAEKIPDVVLS